MKEQASTCQYENGLRLIHIPSPTDVAYCGISIDAGTRDEESGEEGMAHFCEHMMFKGTEKRRAWHIINRMEAVGGDLNAYTNKEETVVYSAFMKEHFERAAELIFDIVFHSTYPQHEIDKECEVIIDEIESYNDSPSELIYDHFENIIFKGSSLGHDILGTEDNVRRFSTEDAVRFRDRLYRPDKMVFFIFGNIDFKKAQKTIAKLAASPVVAPETNSDTNRHGTEGNDCTDMEDEKGCTKGQVGRETKQDERSDADKGSDTSTCDPALTNSPTAGTHIEQRGTHQAHVMIGRTGYGSKSDKRIALYFLNNLIGGPGMNSRLNIALREHTGLVYTVESILTNYTDTATWGIYFGCDAKDVDRCLKLIRKELDKLMDKPLNEKELKAAIKQIKGQIGVACDNFENYALDTAKAYLHYNRFEGVEDTFRHLEQLTPAILQEVAKEMFDPAKLTTLIFT